jgi:hypothetical protein
LGVSKFWIFSIIIFFLALDRSKIENMITLRIQHVLI